MAKTYNTNFYSSRHGNSLYSAETIVNLISDYVKPKSVVDIGCGVGTWLSVFQQSGIKDILGVEGQWVEEENVVIPLENFKKANLEEKIDLERKFDLAVTLEVAEHIDAQYADQFVSNLVNLAPVVMFSAAIPLQGGKHHVNEQWPDYWRDVFAKHDYLLIDGIRPHVWNDEGIEMWYAQNTFVYVAKDKLSDYPELEKQYTENPMMLSAVLPRFYEFKLNRYPIGRAIKNKIKRTF
ncbi:MAG: methyltransferase domain-containing protein [Bacteroidota bacterium]